ncbi:MAG: ATP-binding protein [Bacteroidota bacterium]
MLKFITIFPKRFLARLALYLIVFGSLFTLFTILFIIMPLQEQTVDYYAEKQVAARQTSKAFYDSLIHLIDSSTSRHIEQDVRVFVNQVHQRNPQLYLFVDDWETTQRIANVNQQLLGDPHIGDDARIFEACKKTINTISNPTSFDYSMEGQGLNALFRLSNRVGRIAYVGHYQTEQHNWLVGASVEVPQPARAVASSAIGGFLLAGLTLISLIVLLEIKTIVWQQAINKSSDSIALIDREGTILAGNKMLKTLYSEDIIGSNIETLNELSSDDKKNLLERIRRVLRTHDPETYRSYLLGQDISLETTISSIGSRCIVAIDRNVTDQVKLTEVKEALEAQRELTYKAIFHDTLGKINSSKNVLEKAVIPKLEATLKTEVGEIVSSLENTIDLVDGVKATFYLEHRKSTSEQFDIRDILEKVKEYYRHSIAYFNISVEEQFSHQKLLIEGDRFQVVTLFRNLMSNAIKAISTSTKPQRQINIQTVDDHNQIQLLFSDTGEGMSEMVQNNFLTHHSGMGTWLMSECASRNNIRLEVISSDFERGTTMSIWFTKVN